MTLDPFVNPFAAAPPPKAEARPLTEESAGAPAPAGWNLEEARRELENSYLRRALEKTRYNQKQAAALLGLSYDAFRGLYKKFFPARR